MCRLVKSHLCGTTNEPVTSDPSPSPSKDQSPSSNTSPPLETEPPFGEPRVTPDPNTSPYPAPPAVLNGHGGLAAPATSIPQVFCQSSEIMGLSMSSFSSISACKHPSDMGLEDRMRVGRTAHTSPAAEAANCICYSRITPQELQISFCQYCQLKVIPWLQSDTSEG